MTKHTYHPSLESVKYLCSKDKIIKKIIDTHNPLEYKVAEDGFSALVDSIIGQQLSNKVASVICQRFKDLLDGDISPQNILNTSNEEIRKIGVSTNKIKYLKDLSIKTVDKLIDFDKLKDMSNEDIKKTLQQVKGIGSWTAEMYLIFSLNRLDVLPFLDLGIKKAIKDNYKLDDYPTIKFLEILNKRWSPYQTIAALYLWESLDNQKS